MTPNLLVVFQTISSPHRWFTRKKSAGTVTPVEHWNAPIPGKYEFLPGEGWYLVTPDEPSNYDSTIAPQRVVYSRVLKRWLLLSEYEDRQRKGYLPIPTKTGSPHRHSKEDVGFFRLDDGTTWVNDKDARGKFVEGPYPRFCLDKETGLFRPMRKSDDPEWQSRRSSVSRSVINSSAGSTASRPLSSPTSPDGRPSSRHLETRKRPDHARQDSYFDRSSMASRTDGAPASRRGSRQMAYEDKA